MGNLTVPSDLMEQIVDALLYIKKQQDVSLAGMNDVLTDQDAGPAAMSTLVAACSTIEMVRNTINQIRAANISSELDVYINESL